MIGYLKAHDLKSIQNKIGILYLLNVMDIVFTLILLKTGFFVEANSFMAPIIDKPIITIMLKVFLVFVLLVILSYRIKDATEFQLRFSNYILNVANLAYLTINLSHIVWSIYSIYLIFFI